MNNLPAACSPIPDTHELQVYQLIAKKAADSRLFQALGGEPGIVSVMLYARELGLPPMQAISGGLNVVKGKVELSARTINSMIRRAGHSLKILEHTDEICRIAGKRKDTGEEYEASFGIADAKRAGIFANTWERYPRDMVFNRAISRLGRVLFADVIGNSYVEGEVKEAIEADIKQFPEEKPPVPRVNREQVKPPKKPPKKQTKKAEAAPVEEAEPEIIPPEKPEKKDAPKTVSEAIERYFAWLAKENVAEQGLDYAKSLICKAFDVDELQHIPDDLADPVTEYLAKTVTQELREESWLPLE